MSPLSPHRTERHLLHPSFLDFSVAIDRDGSDDEEAVAILEQCTSVRTTPALSTVSTIPRKQDSENIKPLNENDYAAGTSEGSRVNIRVNITNSFQKAQALLLFDTAFAAEIESKRSSETTDIETDASFRRSNKIIIGSAYYDIPLAEVPSQPTARPDTRVRVDDFYNAIEEKIASSVSTDDSTTCQNETLSRLTTRIHPVPRPSLSASTSRPYKRGRRRAAM